MPVDDLKDALEGRGFAPEGEHTPSLSGLLPLLPEPDLQWLARRAATELAVDPDLRFLRYQGMILPDVQTRPAARRAEPVDGPVGNHQAARPRAGPG